MNNRIVQKKNRTFFRIFRSNGVYIPVIRRMYYFLLLFLTGILLITSCNPQKKIIKAPIREEGADYLFTKLKENELKYDGLSAKFSAEYENKGQTNSFNGQLRIRRDSLIWLSFSPALGIEVIRIAISQDSVKFINRMNNTFFAGDYNYVNRFLNTNIDYDILQSFLTGNDLSFYENGKFKATVDKGIYQLSTAERMKLKKFIRNSTENLRVLIQNIWISPETFKIVQAEVKEIRKPNIKLTADYQSFELIGTQAFPRRMLFDVSAEKNIHVDVSFSRVTLNTALLFPFKVPPNYREVK
jgi:outer membrane lipoprotein-sorting protein